MIGYSISLITAILIYISILSALSSNRISENLSFLMGSFILPLVCFILTIILEVLKTGYGLLPKILGYTSNGIFLVGVATFLLGLKDSSNYFRDSQYDRERLEEAEEEFNKEKTKACPNCGETVNEIVKVCHYCGHQFKGKKKTT